MESRIITEPLKPVEELAQVLPQGPVESLIQSRDEHALLSLKQFEIMKLLGVGSAGHVYLVQKKDTKHVYAMKVLKKDKLTEKAQYRALTERTVLLNAHHPFISTLYFCFQSESKLFILMQYCAGGDFYGVIQRQPYHSLTESQARFYGSCVVLALEYLHFNGVIYRDLKPENILMRASGHIVLTDFDLSICSPETVHSRVTMTPYSHKGGVVSEPDILLKSGLIGTVEYMAPEIIEGVQYTCAVDWWAFGVLMYEMLYGKSPFKGNDMKRTFDNIIRAHVEFPHHPHPEESVSQKCKDLIKHLLHHNHRKRLGVLGGASEIKDHPFFVDVKFQLLTHMTPPIVPHVKSAIDSHYFREITNDPWSTEESEKSGTAPWDPESLPAKSIWKRFSNIDRGDLDPDDLFSSSLTPRRIGDTAPTTPQSFSPPLNCNSGTSSLSNSSALPHSPPSLRLSPPTNKTPKTSPPPSPRAPHSPKAGQHSPGSHHEHGVLHHLFKHHGH